MCGLVAATTAVQYHQGFMKDFKEKCLELTEGDKFHSWAGYMLLALALVIVVIAQSGFWGFVQDDSYITLRYSRNLVEGNGIVFNPGEHVEGYTNFLWMLIGAFFIAIGLPAMKALIIFGALCGLALVVFMPFLSAAIRNERHLTWDSLPALFLSASTTLALWSVSGLEQAFFALCGWLGFYFVLLKKPWQACFFFCITILTRPEGALFPAFSGLYLLILFFSGDRDTWRVFVKPLVCLAAVFTAYHSWRFWYFGDFLPNTYYVKGGGGWTNVEFGWLNIKKLWNFNGNGFFISLAPLALIPRKGRAAAFTLMTFLGTYLLYQIKIGGDILPMYRLHLTILPAQMLLASRAIEGLTSLFAEIIKDEYQPWRRLVWPLVLLYLIGPTVFSMYQSSIGHTEYKGVQASLDAAHGAIGRYLQKNAKPGDLAVAQDMGAMPWHAPSVVFLDTIGLVDRTMAHTHYSESYTPYIRYLLWPDEKARERIKDMEARLRRYTFSRNPRWFVINVDTPADKYDEVLEALRTRHGEYFEPYSEANVFFYDLGQAPEWANYRFIKGWEYSNVHFLLLYERMDTVPE